LINLLNLLAYLREANSTSPQNTLMLAPTDELEDHGCDTLPTPPLAEWRQRHHGGIQPQYR
jgi:hypothetical protein